jgi:hypothetical protein
MRRCRAYRWVSGSGATRRAAATWNWPLAHRHDRTRDQRQMSALISAEALISNVRTERPRCQRVIGFVRSLVLTHRAASSSDDSPDAKPGHNSRIYPHPPRATGF